MADMQAQGSITVVDQASPAIRSIGQAFDQMGESAKNVQQEVGNLTPSTDAAADSIKALSDQAKELQASLEKLSPASAEFAAQSEQLGKVQNSLKGAREEMEKFGPSSEGLNAFKDFMREEVPMLGRFGDLSAIAWGAAAAGVVEFGLKAADAASNMQKVHNNAEVIYGNDMPQIEARVNAAADALGRSDTEMLKFSTNITTFAQGLDVSKGEAEQMGVNLSVLAEEMAKTSTNGSDATQALQALEAALRGNARGLLEYNVAMSDKVLQDYADNMQIPIKVAAMDSEQKAILMYHALMDKTHFIQEQAAKDT